MISPAPPPSEDPRRRRDEEGFTLVELLVVIVIIGLLATIVVINVMPLGDRARSTKAKADIETLSTGLEAYRLSMGTYPSTEQGLQALVMPPAGLSDPSAYQQGGYIRKLEKDPWGRPYLYAAPGQHGAFDVWSLGADGKEGGTGADADIGSWN